MALSIKGFLDTSFIDWPGRMAAVIFLPGCNFRCPYCHNAELVLHAQRVPDIPVRTTLAVLRRLAGWVDGVVVSGGEPTIHGELPFLLERYRTAGLQVKLDTNGSRPEMLSRLLDAGLVQAVDMDLKAPLRRESYRRNAGVDVEPDVLRESVELLRSSGIPHRFRTTYVPGLLDLEDIREMAGEILPSAYVIQGFNPRRVLDTRLRDCTPPSDGDLRRLRHAAVAAGSA